MIDPTPVPGLTDHTVVVIGAGSPFGVATTMTLLASGATVLATDTSAALPSTLVDAGTGLPGVLHYRSVDVSAASALASLSDWIGEQTAGVHGIAIQGAAIRDPATHDPANLDLAAVTVHLLDGASVVLVGEPGHAVPDTRSNVVVPHPDAEPLAVGAAVAFLLSDLAEFCAGAVIPVGARQTAAYRQ